MADELDETPGRGDPATRICLGGCGRPFASRSAGHRICPKCDRVNRGLGRRALREPGAATLESCDADGKVDLTELDIHDT